MDITVGKLNKFATNNVETILCKIASFGVKITTKKRQFSQKSVKIFPRLMTSSGRHNDTQKISQIAYDTFQSYIYKMWGSKLFYLLWFPILLRHKMGLKWPKNYQYLCIYVCIYQLQNRKGCKVSSLMSHSLPAWCYCVDSSYFNTNNTFWRFLHVECRVI